MTWQACRSNTHYASRVYRVRSPRESLPGWGRQQSEIGKVFVGHFSQAMEVYCYT